LQDKEHVRFLDLSSQWLDADGAVKKGITADGLHPNEKGYQIWSDAMQPILQEWLKHDATTQP
jgi:beta-glucosidase